MRPGFRRAPDGTAHRGAAPGPPGGVAEGQPPPALRPRCGGCFRGDGRRFPAAESPAGFGMLAVWPLLSPPLLASLRSGEAAGCIAALLGCIVSLLTPLSTAAVAAVGRNARGGRPAALRWHVRACRSPTRSLTKRPDGLETGLPGGSYQTRSLGGLGHPVDGNAQPGDRFGIGPHGIRRWCKTRRRKKPPQRRHSRPPWREDGLGTHFASRNRPVQRAGRTRSPLHGGVPCWF